MGKNPNNNEKTTKTSLKRLVSRLDVTRFTDPKEFLGAVYHELKANLPNYSYVQFSDDLGFGACNAMYLIIHGTRPLTEKSAQKIVEKIGLKKIERQFFMELVTTSKTKDTNRKKKSFENLLELKEKALVNQLEKEQLQFFSEWYHGAILEILRCPESSDQVQWLTQNLVPRVPPAKVKKSLELLKSLKYLRFDEKSQRFVPSEAVVSTGPEVYGMAILSYHRQMIDLAKNSLVSVGPEDRDITSLTITMSCKVLGEIKNEIAKLRKKIIAMAEKETKNADMIGQVNFQVFPLSKPVKRRK